MCPYHARFCAIAPLQPPYSLMLRPSTLYTTKLGYRAHVRMLYLSTYFVRSRWIHRGTELLCVSKIN